MEHIPPPGPDPVQPRHEFRHYFCAGCGHEIDAPVSCGNRFCPVCSHGPRIRARNRMLKIVQAARENSPEPLRFVTLTIKNCPDPKQGFSVLIDGFRRLRSRPFWKNRVRGGLYVIEATGRAGEWHVHLHALIQGVFIPQGQLSAVWKAVTGSQVVWISSVSDSTRAVQYITQYLTKTDVAGSDRDELAMSLAGCRMFSPFGCWHSIRIPKIEHAHICPCCGHSEWIHDRFFAIKDHHWSTG